MHAVVLQGCCYVHLAGEPYSDTLLTVALCWPIKQLIQLTVPCSVAVVNLRAYFQAYKTSIHFVYNFNSIYG